jgi:hypothetical protein
MKPTYGGFIGETATFTQKWLKFEIPAGRKRFLLLGLRASTVIYNSL